MKPGGCLMRSLCGYAAGRLPTEMLGRQATGGNEMRERLGRREMGGEQRGAAKEYQCADLTLARKTLE